MDFDSSDVLDHQLTAVVDAALQQAWANTRVQPSSFIWESNPWLRQVMGGSSINLMHQVAMEVRMVVPPPVPMKPAEATAVNLTVITAKRVLVAASGPAYVRAVRRLKEVAWRDGQTMDRQRSLHMWKLILDACANFSDTGRQLIEDCATMVSDDAISGTIADTFSKKASGTLYKRGGAILRFMKWCSEQKPMPIPAFPVEERIVYKYLVWLKDTGKAPSVGSDFRSALAFSYGVIGLDSVQPVLKSGRCSGAAHTLLARKRRLMQMDPLEAGMVMTLETVLDDESVDDIDRMGSGHYLALTFFRSRFEDGQNVESLELDVYNGVGFVDAQTAQTKTSNTVKKRNRFLTMSAPSHGLLRTPWAQTWLEVRRRLGMECGRDLPFLPAPKLDGTGFYKRALTSSEGTAWLRQLLAKYGGFDQAKLSRIGTHSCKATTLSWLAKFGVHLDMRRLLGYHSTPGDVSVLTYSRDSMAEPLRLLVKVMEEISAQRFFPDSTRSGRFVYEAASPHGEKTDLDESIQEQPVKRARVYGPILHSRPVQATCELCGSTVGGELSPTKCASCSGVGCTGCKPVTLVDQEMICERCFNRTWSESEGPDGPHEMFKTLIEEWDDERQHPSASVGSGNSTSGFGVDGHQLAKEDSSDDDSRFTTDDGTSDSDGDPDVTPCDDSEIMAAAEAVAEAGKVVRVRSAARGAGEGFFRHKVYKTIHLCKAVDVSMLACGRKCSILYEPLSDLPPFPFPKCGHCFGIK